MTKQKLNWKVHTPKLLKEILSNNATQILKIPMQIFSNILAEVAERASELNDEKLNSLMARLALYDVADPTSKNYNQKIVDELIYPKTK